MKMPALFLLAPTREIKDLGGLVKTTMVKSLKIPL
jgi:hypothetical protein